VIRLATLHLQILEDENGNAVIVNVDRYEILLQNFLILKSLILSHNYWFQQDSILQKLA
jgi:hypothetical protein